MFFNRGITRVHLSNATWISRLFRLRFISHVDKLDKPQICLLWLLEVQSASLPRDCTLLSATGFSRLVDRLWMCNSSFPRSFFLSPPQSFERRPDFRYNSLTLCNLIQYREMIKFKFNIKYSVFLLFILLFLHIINNFYLFCRILIHLQLTYYFRDKNFIIKKIIFFICTFANKSNRWRNFLSYRIATISNFILYNIFQRIENIFAECFLVFFLDNFTC